MLAGALYFTSLKGLQFYKKESLILLYGIDTHEPLLTDDNFNYSNPMIGSNPSSNRKKQSRRGSGSSSGALDDTFEQSNPMYDNDDTISTSFTSPQKRGSVISIGSAESQQSKDKSNEQYNIYTKDMNKNNNDNINDNDNDNDDDSGKKDDNANRNDSSNNRRMRSTDSSIISTDLRYTDIDEKPLIKQPYVIIISVLAVWGMYATLYIGQELTNKCTWGYYVLLTM